MQADAVGPPRWVRRAGAGAILVALPSAVWRVVVGAGVPLGTPEAWRRAQELPGPGTVYVLGLSAGQLAAALLTLVLIVPGADRVAGRRLPTTLVAGTSFAGAAGLAVLCVASALAWDRVDPFADAPTSGWSVLAYASYAVTVAWPVLLVVTTVGYVVHRRPSRPGAGRS